MLWTHVMLQIILLERLPDVIIKIIMAGAKENKTIKFNVNYVLFDLNAVENRAYIYCPRKY